LSSIFQDTIKYLKKDEWQSLKSCIDNIRDKLLITLLYSTGCRVGEICQITVENLDFESEFIRIPAENTKTREPRTVRVGTEVLNDLKAFMKAHKIKDGRIFKISTRRVQQIVRKYAGRAGIQKVYAEDKNGNSLNSVTPHTLRHTHIVHSLVGGVDLSSVQNQVGHKRLSTTQIYARLAPEQVKQAYNRAGID
jgi:integrase